MEKPDIFKHHDYREFLRQFFDHRKLTRKGLNRARVAKALGISASNLSMILSGERKLTIENAIRLAKELGLEPSERRYFEALVMKADAGSQDVAVDSLRRMNSMKTFRQNNPQEAEVFRYLTHWYYVVIREMAAMPGFKLEAKWIKKRLLHAVPIPEIQKAIDFLVSHQFIQKSEDGTVLPPDKPLDCMDGVYRMALVQFHQEMLNLASRSIGSTPSEQRNILGFTLVGDAETFKRASEIIQKAQSDIRALSQESCENRVVYHAELCLFPLTQAADAEGGSL